MGYVVEVVFDMRKQTDIAKTKTALLEAVYENEGSGYFIHEFENRGKHIGRQLCVLICEFDDATEVDTNEMSMSCASFLKRLSTLKSGVFVDTMYTSPKHKLLYVSKSFLSRMDKSCREQYKHNSRELKLNPEELFLISEIPKRC